jgi:membrane protein DedA with SNARE-associated domain
LLDGSAALISVPIWVLAGWYFGEALEEALGFAKQIQLFLLGFVGFVIFVYFLLRWRRKQKDIALRLKSLRSPGESNLKKRQTLIDHNS